MSVMPPGWWHLFALAREANKRCLWHARVQGTRRVQRAGTYRRTNHRLKTNGWPKEPRFTGYRPTVRQWMALFALEDGPLEVGDWTVPGVNIDVRVQGALERAGLIKVVGAKQPRDKWDSTATVASAPARIAELTDEGRMRVERKW